jgi:hypothetical protein
MRCLRHDQTAIGKHQTGRNAQVVGEFREFISLAVFVGILADQDVIATAGVLAFVGIIFGDQYK